LCVDVVLEGDGVVALAGGRGGEREGGRGVDDAVD